MSTGLYTLVADGTGTATITRPGGHSVTVPITVSTGGGTPTPYLTLHGGQYASDAAFKADINATNDTSPFGGSNEPTGSGSGCRFMSSLTAGLILWDSSYQYNGHATFKKRIIYNSSSPSTSAAISPKIDFLLGNAVDGKSNLASAWLEEVIRFDPASTGIKQFTTLGDGADGGHDAHGNTYAAAYKVGDHFTLTSGTPPRAGVAISNVTEYTVEGLGTDNPTSTNITTEWSGSDPWHLVHYWQQVSSTTYRNRVWLWKDGATKPTGSPIYDSGVITPGGTIPSINGFDPWGLNYNRNPNIGTEYNVHYCECNLWNAAVDADPLTLL